MAVYIKDPQAVLDYMMDWADPDEGPWLATGEEIVASSWIVSEGVTADSDTSDATTATVWLSGGTAGQTYAITNRITTNKGRTDDRTMQIVVRER